MAKNNRSEISQRSEISFDTGLQKLNRTFCNGVGGRASGLQTLS